MWYASRICRSKKPLNLSKIFTVQVLLQAAVSACKSLKCAAIAELFMSSFNKAFLCSLILNLSNRPVFPIYVPTYDLLLQFLFKRVLHCIEKIYSPYMTGTVIVTTNITYSLTRNKSRFRRRW